MSRRVWSKLNHFFGILIYLVFLAYFGTSIASLIINFEKLKWWGFTLNFIVLILEMIGPSYVVYFMVQLLDGILQVNKIEYDLNKLEEYPKLAVMIPVRNAHPIILRETLEGFKRQTYPNFELWVGDDFSDEKFSTKYREIVNDLNFNYHYGKHRSYKAGILNQITPKTSAKYIAIFDVDQIPEPKILEKFVAILEQNHQYSFVQAKFDFREVKNLMHTWEMINYYQLACAQSGKMGINNVLWHGCNACFRRESIYPIPEGKLSEDFDHTIQLLSKGEKGCWLEEIGVMTLATDTFDHKMSQMFRWTTGQVGAFKDHWKKYFNSKLTSKQSLDLYVSSTLTLVLSSMYFVGLLYAVLYLLKVPIFRALVLEDIAMIIVPILIGSVYLVMITATSVYSIRHSTYKINIIQIIFFLLFSSLTAPILLIPTIQGLLGKNKLIPGKTQWNRKIRLYLISAITSFFGLIYLALGIFSILDNFKVLIDWYPGGNYFYTFFLLIAFMLTAVFPFIVIVKQRYRKSLYLRDEYVYI
ncbi:MAG: glycosyltransferase [Candidatus Heimdallarchaeota archaeon]|nr:glycosyltransferase [Candidatus Heimdallarchaeota archaeon]